MIKSCKERETRQRFTRQRSRRLPPGIQQVALRQRRRLNNAHARNDLQGPPANRLDTLAGDRAGPYRSRLNDRWRGGVAWRDGDAAEVELVEYP